MSNDHNYTKEIVCPYCGYEFSDSWEYGNGEDIGETECGECGKIFHARRNIQIDYSTETDCELNGEEHDRIIDKHMDRCSKCDAYLIKDSK